MLMGIDCVPNTSAIFSRRLIGMKSRGFALSKPPDLLRLVVVRPATSQGPPGPASDTPEKSARCGTCRGVRPEGGRVVKYHQSMI